MSLKKYVQSSISKVGYSIRSTAGIPRQLMDSSLAIEIDFHHIICRYLVEKKQALTFLQIGAFDGEVGDPLARYISRYEWSGILVEPQYKAVCKLNNLYSKNDRIKILNKAIDDKSGCRVLYTVNGDGLPEWAEALASFDKSTILKHKQWLPRIEELILETTIETDTFQHVLAMLESSALDLLQLDTEGADAAILSYFPFDVVRPAIVHWESKHLSKKDAEGCLARLASFGYKFCVSRPDDTVAVLQGTFDA